MERLSFAVFLKVQAAADRPRGQVARVHGGPAGRGSPGGAAPCCPSASMDGVRVWGVGVGLEPRGLWFWVPATLCHMPGGRPRELDTSACLACVPRPWCGPAPESGPPGVQLPWARVWSLRPLGVVLPWGCVSAIWLDGDRQPRAPPPIQSCQGLAARGGYLPMSRGQVPAVEAYNPQVPLPHRRPWSWPLLEAVCGCWQGREESTEVQREGALRQGVLGRQERVGFGIEGRDGGHGRLWWWPRARGSYCQAASAGAATGWGGGMLSQPLWPGCGQIRAWPLEAPSVQRG